MTFDKLFLILVAAALTGCGGGTSSSSKGIEIDLDSDSVAAEDVGEPVSIIEKDYHVLTPFTYITNLSSVNIPLQTDQPGRFTQGVARLLKAKSAAWQGNWSECAAQVNAIEQSGVYSLLPDLNSICFTFETR